MISKKKLWEIQLQEHPNSIQLTIEEVFYWCDQGFSPEDRAMRYRQVASALYHSNVVFYRIENTRYRGFRFGLEGSEYASFSS